MSNPPKPPYGPHDVSLGTVLTPVQRSTIIAWLPKAWAWEAANGWSRDTPLPASLSALPDDTLIKEYGLAYATIQIHDTSGITLNPVTAVEQAGITNPLTSVEQFLSLLSNKNLWLRVAEFTIGATLLAIAFNAILKPGDAVSNFPAVRAVRKLA